MNWYVKYSQNSFWRNGYLSYGHSYTESDPYPLSKDEFELERQPPEYPNDAIWIFDSGIFKCVTAQEWYNNYDGRGYTFVHEDVFGDKYSNGSYDNYFKGRFDSKENIVSVVKNNKIPTSSVLLRTLERRFPRARIMEF